MITGPTLALLVIIQMISDYSDFHDGVKQIVKDYRAVIEQVGSSAGAKTSRSMKMPADASSSVANVSSAAITLDALSVE